MRTWHFAAWLIAVIAGAIYTIIQTGPDTAGENLCKLVQKAIPSISNQCVPSFQLWGPKAILGIAIVFGILAIWDLVSWIRKRRSANSHIRRASHSRNFIGIMEAIYWIAETSAWGRWQDAQRRASGGTLSELFKFSDAERALRTAAENGELLIQGREKKSVEYKDFDQHFWRTAYFEVEPDQRSLWKVTIRPKTGANVSISEYDDVWTEKRRIEVLWRRRDWQYDWPRLQLNIRSAWKRMKDAPKPPAVETSQASEAPRAIETSATFAGSGTVQAESSIKISVTPLAPENWERLFVIGDDGRSVWLRFLPDTKHYRADTLVLIVFGQKVLRDVSRLGVEAAHAAVEKTVHNAPNQPKTNIGLIATMIAMQQLGAAINRDWVDECVPLYMQRVGLSQGGFYQLTESGESHAAALAYDLIQRA
jgi:hypothetical protein